MMEARYTGTMTHWDEQDGFGEITMQGHAPLVVYRNQLHALGISQPVVGMRFDFSIGVHANGQTGAVNLSRVVSQ